MVYKNSKGRVIGKTHGKIFYKEVKASKHLLRKWGGCWGIDKQVLDSLVRDGIEKIVILEKEEMINFSVSVKTFVELGGVEDFGHGEQVFLGLDEFSQEKIKPVELEAV